MSATITATEEKAPALSISAVADETQSSGDFLDDLGTNGYAVIKGAIPMDRAKSYQQRALSWLQSFGSAFSLTDPSTWVKKNLPVQSSINTFNSYGVVHEKFMWDARTEPGILAAFEKLYDTSELLVSFDALNITLPNRPDKPSTGKKWPHVDQSPFRLGRQCVQGIINLSEAGPRDGSLMVYPGSHLLIEEFFATQTKREDWTRNDYYSFSPEQMEWFDAHKIAPIKVLAEPGDLILWDSRTVHWGAEPEKDGGIRTVIYASYAPAELATKESLETKAKVFKAWGATTHWAHENIVSRETRTLLEDGTQDPRDRSGPKEKPEMTEQILKLAGVKQY